jgi:hypothetical protein
MELIRSAAVTVIGATVSLPVLLNLVDADERPHADAGDAPSGHARTQWLTTNLEPAALVAGTIGTSVVRFDKIIFARVGQNIYAKSTSGILRGCTVQAAKPDFVCKCNAAHCARKLAKMEPAGKLLACHPLRLASTGFIEVDTGRHVDATDSTARLAVK